jgi:hypothetical protein
MVTEKTKTAAGNEESKKIEYAGLFWIHLAGCVDFGRQKRMATGYESETTNAITKLKIAVFKGLDINLSTVCKSLNFTRFLQRQCKA